MEDIVIVSAARTAWVSLVVHSPKLLPRSWALSSFVKRWHAPKWTHRKLVKSSWVRCWPLAQVKTLRVKR